MKKLTYLVAALLILCFLTVGAEADENLEQVITRDRGPSTIIGFDLPTIGWARYDAKDRLVGWRGINLGIGYSQKTYFDPLKMDQFNPFWEVGTIALIIPYLGIGAEYPFAVGDEGNYVSFSGAIGLYVARIGVSYAF